MLRASRLLAAAAALPLLAGCSTVTMNGNAVRTPEAPVIAAMTQPVRTQQGLVHGVSSRIEGVTVFRGVPFAAPPVGDLRWQPPQAPVSWSGVRDASQYGAPCIQTPAPQRFPVNPATDLGNAPPPSEDCLFLNIWTPAQAAGEKLP
ncbi:MAG TPA: carboxylesterase family protein, partial [Alteraurantiacibacter sp.]